MTARSAEYGPAERTARAVTHVPTRHTRVTTVTRRAARGLKVRTSSRRGAVTPHRPGRLNSRVMVARCDGGVTWDAPARPAYEVTGGSRRFRTPRPRTAVLPGPPTSGRGLPATALRAVPTAGAADPCARAARPGCSCSGRPVALLLAVALGRLGDPAADALRRWPGAGLAADPRPGSRTTAPRLEGTTSCSRIIDASVRVGLPSCSSLLARFRQCPRRLVRPLPPSPSAAALPD